MKISDICILLSVAVAFVTTAFLWFQGVDTKQEALFTATWIPSILAFAIYFKIIARKN
tara:strand:- start:1302 stop:1475 length:174 start_codon:yes stop_codon:yes gene_type:complete